MKTINKYNFLNKFLFYKICIMKNTIRRLREKFEHGFDIIPCLLYNQIWENQT